MTCSRDTDGDGNCGRRYCPECGDQRDTSLDDARMGKADPAGCERALQAESLVDQKDEAISDLLHAMGHDSFWGMVGNLERVMNLHYPADLFSGVSGDPGDLFVSRVRVAIEQLHEDLARRVA